MPNDGGPAFYMERGHFNGDFPVFGGRCVLPGAGARFAAYLLHSLARSSS